MAVPSIRPRVLDESSSAAAQSVGRPASVGFDLAVTGLCAWFAFGAYLDSWAHRRFPELETFFTP